MKKTEARVDPTPDSTSNAISTGGHFGTSYSVQLDESVLTYRYSKLVTNFPPEWAFQFRKNPTFAEAVATFRAALDQLEVCSWRTDYQDPSVCDGTGWGAEIVSWDRAIRSHGQLISRQEWRFYFDCRSHRGRHFRAVLQTCLGACWPPLSVAPQRH
jgi:hypothetical protein